MNARTETLAEVINWLGDEADREWERAKDGLSDGYGGFMRLRAPGYSEIQVTSGGERMWPRWKAYLFTSDGRRRTVDGPRDVGLTSDRAAELFFRDIMASIEQGEDR